MKQIFLPLLAGLAFFLSACTPKIELKHKIDPIYITVDVNIKAEEELNDFFTFEDDGSAPAEEEPEPENEEKEPVEEPLEKGENQ